MIHDFIGTLAKKEYLTKDVLFFSLKVPESFSFEAGQFVTLKIEKEGTTKYKSYSILSPPSQKGELNFCVKIIPHGFASDVFKDMLLGQEFRIKGPLGHLLLNSAAQEHWFICVGTGVTPFYSMIQEYLPKHPEPKFKLIFGVRNEEDLFFGEEFKALQKRYRNFEYLATLSQGCWNGHTGRVQKYLEGELQDKTFYICGLKEMVLETKELLLQQGVQPENIKVERYT